jgi:hypothetical protein
MKESDWRYIVDAILYVCLGGMTLIGILLGLVVPAGPAVADSAKYFLGLHRHQWGNIHAYLSIAFVALIVVHIVFNWKWVTAKTRQIFKRWPAPALAVTAYVPFLVLFLFWLGTPKDSDRYREYELESSEKGHFQKRNAEELTPLPEENAGTEERLTERESHVDISDRGDYSWR